MPNLGLNLGLGVGGGALLPASPSEILQDLQFGVESDGLTLKDNKAGANVDEPELRNVSCIQMDGVSDELQVTAKTLGSDFTYIRRGSFDTYTDVYLFSNTGNNRWVRITQTAIEGFLSGSFVTKNFDSSLPATGVNFELKLVFDNTDLYVYVDGVLNSSIAWGGTFSLNDIDLFEVRATASASQKVNYISVLKSGLTDEWNFTESGGGLSYNTGDGTWGDMTLAPATPGDFASMWSTEDGIYSRNHDKGFSLYEYVTLLLSTVISGELLNLIPDLTQVPA